MQNIQLEKSEHRVNHAYYKILKHSGCTFQECSVKPETLSFGLATTWMMRIAVPSAFPFFFFSNGLWSNILDLFVKLLIWDILQINYSRSSLHEMQCLSSLYKYLFLFSIAIKRIVRRASTTQPTAYMFIHVILLTSVVFSWHQNNLLKTVRGHYNLK